MPSLEIAVQTVEDARQAALGGADSIEIMRDLSAGGLTPDLDVVHDILAQVRLPANVIVRPHAHGFFYNQDDLQHIWYTAKQLTAMGVASIVFSAVTVDNRLDIGLMQQLRDHIAPVPLTSHRALDQSHDPEVSLAALVGVASRVLTSGPSIDAWAGRHGLRTWVRRYGQHFRFVASGGITADQLAELARYTGVHELHLGGAARNASGVQAAIVQRLAKTLRDMENSDRP